MAVDQRITATTATKPLHRTHLDTASRCQTRRGIFFIRRNRNKLPTVRLGGGKKPRPGLFVVRFLKKTKLRWLKLQYTCMLRKMKKYYRDLIKDIIEAGSTVEALQQRMFMESTFAVPVMSVSVASYPYATGSDRSRPYLF
ncbi:Subtilase family protein [Hibiscus syriacus]|uniref:Subtilase family protein n=1 Tax=Hibiscus syriacus TaxID=106335 RepID=A0A6A2XMG5_HIBSY|nr:uncharacterized protein LOC120190279 [Hibiscus syriacus]KAE8659579.1 Subtilase family protein [Hibiscus syriacus]